MITREGFSSVSNFLFPSEIAENVKTDNLSWNSCKDQIFSF